MNDCSFVLYCLDKTSIRKTSLIFKWFFMCTVWQEINICVYCACGVHVCKFFSPLGIHCCGMK